ncbi:phosphosulfolactate synthase [Thermoflavimicrobium dichotomicum]|uniref:Phosphosulfolactate synthase n=1 Tax=Thermoflavimicrobium dichotomicum TaxID=46223 RepID=A0A1I3QD03_9BACL|nr:phosphosulfolactate synthase [Thermoflavimicrobium dichotomicum]SFJ31600.1 phosphosulfolactate synthase [Thermoflavimicrobium dichotomicum]
MKSWHTKWIDRSQKRKPKPRTCGLNCLIDKGLGLHAFYDLLELAGDHIDFIKLGFGTAGITPPSILQEKISLARQYDVHLYPGGTFFEIAYTEGHATDYFTRLQTMGFEWVEISDGTIDLPLTNRSQLIYQARQQGLIVITEIGKKKEGSFSSLDEFITLYQHDIRHGAAYVTMEGRESGINVGLYNKHGDMDIAYLQKLVHRVNSDSIIWEAPLKKQQVTMLQLLGSEVNLGNIPPTEVLAVESLRRGLRSETFHLWESSNKQQDH